MSKAVSMQRSAVIVAATSVFGLAMALYVIRAGGGAQEPDEPPPEVPGLHCGARADQSRWAATDGEYVRTARFGQGSDGWLQSVAGLTRASDGEVTVFDVAAARITVLSDHLLALRQFGRAGEGPGEISAPPLFSAGASGLSLLDVTDSLIFVYDGTAVEVFGRDGEFRQQLSGIVSGLVPPFTLRSLRSVGPEVLYAYDSLDIGGTGRRRLQTWAITGRGRQLVFEMPLERPPMPGRMVIAQSREARPLWATHGSCLVMSDGSTERLFIYHRSTARVDTFDLPRHRVPALGEMDEGEAAAIDGVRQALASRGVDMPDPRRTKPAAVSRWTDLVVDRDGFVWVRPWTPPDRRSAPVDVLRMNLVSGHVERDTVPAFPKAFGAPGVFFSVERDTITDEILVTRYALAKPEP